MTSSRPSEQIRGNNSHFSETSDGDSAPIQRNQLSSDPVISREKNVASTGASCLTRQPGQLQSRPRLAQTLHQSFPEKPNQMRPQGNVAKEPQIPKAARMTSPANLQAATHGLRHQLPQLAVSSCAPQRQQQQNVQSKQHPQRPASSDQPRPAVVSQGKRMDTANFIRPSIQSQTSHHQNPPKGLTTGQASPNKIRESGSTNNKAQPSQPASRVNFPQNASRPLPPQSQFKVFSVPQNQGPHPYRQKPGDMMPLRHPPEYDDEDDDMYDDEEDGDYDEEMDEEEMQYTGFPNSFGYDFNSSDDDDDDDELSEEESALLEELRVCDDEGRYNDIIRCLHEKGIESEEIEELLNPSNHPLDMYSRENFPGEASGDEDEAEGTVSSSSQSHLPQIRHHSRVLPAAGHVQSVMPAPQAAGFNKQTGPSSTPAMSNVGRGQQRMVPRHIQQHVSGPGHAHASAHSASQGQPVQQRQWGKKQQLDLKLTGQPKKIFQNSPSQLPPGTPQGNSRQPQDKDMVSQPLMEDSDSAREDVKQTGNIDEQSCKEINTSQAQLQTEEARLQTGRNNTKVASRSLKIASVSSKVDESQACSRPLQQRDTGQKYPDEQGGFVGPSLVQPTGVRGQAQKMPPYAQAKSAGALGTSIQAQLEDATRPGKSVSNSAGVQQKMLPTPELKAALEKSTAPSEASLARLNVEYMQKSLDLEIKAKKTVNSPPAHLSGHKNLNIRHPLIQHRHPSAPYMNRHPPGRPHQASHLHGQPASPAAQPKHQLPPRQPIPAIINPNSNINVASSAGKPVCSVVPFTLENQGQAVSTNVPKANPAPQNETFIRPQNPVSTQPEDSANSLPQSPGMLQNRPKTSAVQGLAPPAAPSPTIALSKTGQPGKATSLSSNQAGTPRQTQHAQAQASLAPPTQTQQPPTQTQQPPMQTQQPPMQTQQPPTQTQQPPMQTQQPPMQTQQPPMQTQQPPTQTQQPPTQPPTQTQQPPMQTQQPPTQTQQPPTQTRQPPTQTQQPPTQIQQPPTQIQQPPTHAQQTPTHVPPSPTQTPTQTKAPQLPTQTKQVQVQSAQAKQPPIQTQQPPTPTQAQQPPTPTQAQQPSTHTQAQQLPTQPKQGQVQPAQTQAQQTPTQAQQTHTQAQQPPTQTQAQQPPTQTQQTLMQAPTQTKQAQVHPAPAQVQQPPTHTQAQHTPVQAQQTPAQTKQAQVQPSQAHPPHTEATQPSTQTQPAPGKSSKADSFSVDRLSKDKCVITGKGKNQNLVANMVYQIRSPIDGSFVLALWNGDKFEDLKQTGLTTTSGASPEKARSEAHRVHTGQSSSGGTPPGQATYIKPLAPAHGQHRQDHPHDDCDDDDDDEDGYDNDDDSIFKKPFVEQPKEAYCRVCPFCGFTSTDMKRCESCRRIFRGDIKVVHINRQTSRPSTASRSEGRGDRHSVESAHKEHVGQVAAANRVKGGASLGQGDSQERSTGEGKDEDDEDSDSEDFAAVAVRQHDSLGSNSFGLEKRPATGNSKDVAPRKRQRRLDDLVTVTISSDEDEPSSTSSSLSRHSLSPTGHAGSKPPSFLFPPPRPVKSPGKLRQEPAQDEEQNGKMNKNGQHPPLPRFMFGPGEAEEDEDDEEDGEMERDEDEEPPMYEIDIRSVRVGSMRTQPEGPLLISLEGVCIKVRSERTEEIFDFEILAHEVEKVKYFLGEIQPVLYLFVSQDCGEKIRALCHMEPGDEEFFDPSSTDMKQKMIVVIIEGFSYMSHEMLRETLSLWADLNQVEDDNFIEELTDEQSNDLLIQSAPPVLTMDIDKDLVRFRQRNMKKMAFDSSAFPSSSDNNDNEPDSTSSSPPEVRCHYYGSSIRLLQYPPPPAKRLSITTEDLFCLTEGEFLNDVIIDFYLQYLYLEKLSEENRRRTHIFSSFFYKRLMQKDRHDRSEEDAKKSLPDRRHARVKKWTKKVDLFSKDFIVIPINENSHWYLAVICFPGLGGPEAVQYIPSAAHMEDLDEAASDVPGETDGAEERIRQGSAYRTILGQQLDDKQRSDSTDIKPLVGQKQPCILMFDSLAGPSRIPNVRILREYLQCEWNAKKSEPRQITKVLRSCTPDVPQQSNFSDCGVYLLQYVESFFEDPIGDFEIPMEGLEHWFPEEIVHNKRREIHELIMSLHRQYQMERGDPNILDLQFESTPREAPSRFYPDYDEMSGHEEDMNYEPNQEMMSEMDEDMNYDASYEMAARLGEDMNYDPNYEMPSRPDEDMNYDPNYEMASRPDEDMNYEANRDHENSNSGFSEEAAVGEDASSGGAVEDKG